MQEARAICLVVDGRDGLMPFDEHIAAYIRKLGKPVLLIVNKVDGMEKEELMCSDFHVLGFPLVAVSAEHGNQIPLKICLLGRPNAGKSSILNAFVGKERMIVSDLAGTTRDSVDVPLLWNGKKYVFVDTAGVRRRSKIFDTVERFSVNSSLKSTTKADVTFLVIDALQGLTAQDKRLVELLDERKTPFLIILNKMDLVPAPARKALQKQ